jgi:hypothetical protein
MQSAKVSASFKHGITTVSSGAPEGATESRRLAATVVVIAGNPFRKIKSE